MIFEQLPQLVDLPEWTRSTANTLKILAIDSCYNLVSLPDWLGNLTTLQSLFISNCGISSLPDNLCKLTALKELYIQNCDRLTKRCQSGTGEDWCKIAHVPNIFLT